MSDYMKLNWKAWVYGLFAAIIGGGASSVGLAFAAVGLTPNSYNLNAQLGNTIKLMIAAFILNGLVTMFAYLSKSPLPQIEVQVESTKTEGIGTDTVTKTTTTVTGQVPPATPKP